MTLKWERESLLDYEEAKTPAGIYSLVRTWSDTSLLKFNGKVIASASGSHKETKEFAEQHALSQQEGRSDG